ncbi:hypothetical protein AAFC00_000662 [Neodothiora populina]
MLSFLDRSNLGNAKAAGLETDLGLSGVQFHWILDGFYVTYILFEFMTICYRIFPPHKYIAACIAAMGAIAALQSVATSFTAMLMLRLCLGIAEAAFGPGIPFYLSFFFKRDELARRTGIFIAAAPLASSFAGSLAWLILRFAQGSSIDGWRLLFIAEGFPNMLLAVVAWYIIPDTPGSASWLSAREQKIAALRLRTPTHNSKPIHRSASSTKPHSLDWRAAAQTLRDPKSYLLASILFALNISFSSLPVFLPTIVRNMGFSSLAAQGLSAFPNLFAFIVVLATAALSDRYKSRSVPLIVHALAAATGYAVLATCPQMPEPARYACLFPLTAGFFSAVTMVIVWTINNQVSDEGKAVGSSVLQVFGHVGSLVGQQLYSDVEAPYYSWSHGVCALFMLLAAALALVLRVVLGRANRRGGGHGNGSEEEEFEEALMGGMGVYAPERRFEYIL